VKTFFILAAALSLAAACTPNDECGPSEGVVARVIDGDTIELESGVTIRYLAIDTPEIAQSSSGTSQCFGDEAKRFNEDLVAGQTVSLVYDVECLDTYNRTLAYVSIGDREVNSLLVERGFARVDIFPPNGVDREAELRVLENLAKQEERGLWGACQ
tara:strand:+ start:115912 stop:116382 length:471 start_codon:yes stop_codon:yes gene_type:complete